MPPEIRESIADLIGNTPLIRLKHVGAELGNNILAKCEFLNPGGSVKDRIAFHMIKKAEESGALSQGDTIVEATAGNTGIGLALACALRGYKLVTVMSAKVSSDKVNLLKALGAETVITPSGKSVDHPDHNLNMARRIAKERGGWFANQFFNATNVEVHYETTGPEIWRQTNGGVDVIVAGVGTGGTITGVGRYLKEQKPSVRVILADPVGSLLADFVRGDVARAGSSYLVEGIGQDFIPGNLDTTLIDEVVEVNDSQSVSTAKELLQKEAMFVGSSSGCICYAAQQISKQFQNKGLNIVAILPDGGRGYLSTIYNDNWLSEKLQSQ